MWLIAGLSEGMLILSILAKVGGGAEGKEGHVFLETPLLVQPLLEVGVLIGEAIEAPSIQPYPEFQERVTDQHGQEEVLG